MYYDLYAERIPGQSSVHRVEFSVPELGSALQETVGDGSSEGYLGVRRSDR